MWIETISVVLLLVAAASPPAAPVAKDPVPDAESQKKALREIQEVYRADLARAAKPSERLPLARKLLQAAGETLADPPGRYELAVSARDIAIEAGAVDPAFAAIDFLEKYFQLDASTMRGDALSRLSHTVRSGEDAKALYKRCDALLDGELAADHYDKAIRYADFALSAARRAGDPAVASVANVRDRETHLALLEFSNLKEAQAKLAADPADPAANTAIGRFRCIVKGDWLNGLPLLAHGVDGPLKTLANQELFADPADAVKVADGWWDLADKEPDLARQLRWHAAEGYRSMLPKLTGLTKAKVQERLAEAGPPPANVLVPKGSTPVKEAAPSRAQGD